MEEELGRSDEAKARLGRIAAAMTALADEHEEATPDDKVIVMMQDGKMGMVHTSGYGEDDDAIAAMFTHLSALFESQGRTLLVMPMAGAGGVN